MDKSGLMFPKPGKKKKRKRHPDSILQGKTDRRCYLCVLLDDNHTIHGYLEEHHIFFSKHMRALSEEYGLKVRLCIRHHREGPLAVHSNRKNRRILEVAGQQAFETKYGREKFLEAFGENYIDEE